MAGKPTRLTGLPSPPSAGVTPATRHIPASTAASKIPLGQPAKAGFRVAITTFRRQQKRTPHAHWAQNLHRPPADQRAKNPPPKDQPHALRILAPAAGIRGGISTAAARTGVPYQTTRPLQGRRHAHAQQAGTTGQIAGLRCDKPGECIGRAPRNHPGEVPAAGTGLNRTQSTFLPVPVLLLPPGDPATRPPARQVGREGQGRGEKIICA